MQQIYWLVKAWMVGGTWKLIKDAIWQWDKTLEAKWETGREFNVIWNSAEIFRDLCRLWNAACRSGTSWPASKKDKDLSWLVLHPPHGRSLARWRVASSPWRGRWSGRRWWWSSPRSGDPPPRQTPGSGYSCPARQQSVNFKNMISSTYLHIADLRVEVEHCSNLNWSSEPDVVHVNAPWATFTLRMR